MNSKSRIRQVILVNWKGMFFQPFSLDNGMTILEGANGTGKTTIMIAAYTCLMPDLNFLNFQNVSAMNVRKNEDKGLYGRLGEGDPVFSLLDIVTADGNRHLMGVQLIKKTYPQVQLKHFAVRNLNPDTDLEQILLIHHADSNRQEIPSLAEIGQRASADGGELIYFRHAREYFRFLFESGITPIRMAENDERKQYNQLLHTSLYGGLSRSLQSSLRDYLLPQDNTLLSSIQDMEQNLLTCRRTRATIRRYQSVRATIQGVYQNGLDMFSAGFFATRLAAEQSLKKTIEIRNDRRNFRNRWESLSAKIIETKSEMFEQEDVYRRSVTSLDNARRLLDIAQSARDISREIEGKQSERDRQQESAEKARTLYAEVREAEKVNRSRNQELTNQQLELARKLSNAGEAWESLSRQVGLYQQASRLLLETRDLLDNDEITPENIDEWTETAAQRYTEAEAAHQKAYDQWQETNLKHKHRSRYLQLLEELEEEGENGDTGENGDRPRFPLGKSGSVPVFSPIFSRAEQARQICDDFRDLEARFDRSQSIPEKLAGLEEKISQRNELLEHLEAADFTEVTTSEELETAWQALSKEIEEREQQLVELRDEIREKKDALDTTQRQLPDLKSRLKAWEAFQEGRKQLEDRTTRSISSRKELSYMRKSLEDRQLKLNLERYRVEADLKQKQLLFNTLLSTGTADERLKALTEEGYGKLLAGRYEDIPAEWSANLESRLGPLTNALVVKDVQAAAEELAKNFNRPDDVWLVEKDQQEKLPESRELVDSILVKHGDAWRLSRLPEHPSLGKKARTEKVESLREEIGKLTGELEKIRQRIKGAEEDQALLAKLLPGDAFLEADSPLEAMEELETSIPVLQEELREMSSREGRFTEMLETSNRQRGHAQQTFRLRDLLAETDLEKRREELEAEQAVAADMQAEIEIRRDAVRELQQGLETLADPHTGDPAELETALEKARRDEERARSALEALQRLSEKREHFQYEDQVPLLEEKKGFNKHLNDQLAEIEKEQVALEADYTTLSEKLLDAERDSRDEDKKLITLEGQLEQLRENLEKLSVEGSDEEVSGANEQISEAEQRKAAEEKRLNELKTAGFQMEAEIKQVQENKLKSETAWKRVYAQTIPVLDAWRQFRNQARGEGKLERLMAEYHAELQSGRKKPDRFWRQESAARATLLKTLESMNNTRVLLDTIRANRSEESDEISQGSECLFIWQQIRGFLNQVIPVDLQTSDPEKAQATIAEKLDTLESNLEQQERSLRQHVQNIPAHINAKIRKEKSRIRQLNQKLEAVRFGFLQTIRINIETQPKLKAFLDVLPQQLDFFTESETENVPVETLMANLYEEMGAGRVKGDLLLDYRHYVRLNIEVRREGNEDFETVTSTNLSTGESIGVGISVLIMVLMSWEDQANLLRGTGDAASLRFLMLDESSRLDQKALATLNEFCEGMELQLLIAAPSVEKTLRGTTHHLTRGYYDGREEVIVRGRRLN